MEVNSHGHTRNVYFFYSRKQAVEFILNLHKLYGIIKKSVFNIFKQLKQSTISPQDVLYYCKFNSTLQYDSFPLLTWSIFVVGQADS